MDTIVQLIVPVLEGGKSAKFTVVGNSMYPLFRSGADNVIVAKPKKIKSRDIILYRRKDGTYVLHRVLGKGEQGYKLCGDRQYLIEYPVKTESVLAVVTSFERNGRTYSTKNLLYNIYSLMWCLAFPLRPAVAKVYRLTKRCFKKENKNEI